MTHDDFTAIIDAALAEDIGTGDITSELLIPPQLQADMLFVARENMVACGMFIPGLVYARLIPPPVGGRLGGGHDETPSAQRPHPSMVKKQHPNVVFSTIEPPPIGEGIMVTAGTVLVAMTGHAQALLTGERVVLNLMQRMCGVATLTRAYVDAVAGTRAVILDTRKTMPGLRAVDKYAVRAGGGRNHRMGLYDAVMIKDNHIALKGQGILGIVKEVRQTSSLPIIVECDTLQQVAEALAAKPDRILLDNMDVETMRRAVELAGGRVPLEASGGVSLHTVKAIAHTGVDYISVGKLTHSAIACDIGADVVFR